MTEQEFYSIVENVCAKPKFYTMNGSFYEVVSYLEGYAKHALKHVDNHNALTPFLQWMSDKEAKNIIKFDWNNFLEMFLNEEEALKNLPILFREYVSEI